MCGAAPTRRERNGPSSCFAATRAPTSRPLYCPQAKDQLRYNLLKIPMVRRLLRSSLWPQDINK